MHALHCILVEVDGRQVDSFLQTKDQTILDELKMEARYDAMEATRKYYDDVYDWRTEDDAGRWAEDFPDNSVVLGVLEPERLKELLQEFRQKPLEEAMKLMDKLECFDCAYRTQDDINSDPHLVILNLQDTCTSESGELRYWSGKPNMGILFNKEFLQQVWNNCFNWMNVWRLKKALSLACGDYYFESQFYSVPDDEALVSKNVLYCVLTNPSGYALVFSDYHI